MPFANQFRRFGDEQAAICGQSEWLVRYSDFTLNFTGREKLRFNAHSVTKNFHKFSVDSRFKILSSEKEVKTL